ncbi:MAG: hypothetical protein RLP27_07205 [Rhodospirillales bacterium]
MSKDAVFEVWARSAAPAVSGAAFGAAAAGAAAKARTRAVVPRRAWMNAGCRKVLACMAAVAVRWKVVISLVPINAQELYL